MERMPEKNFRGGSGRLLVFCMGNFLGSDKNDLFNELIKITPPTL